MDIFKVDGHDVSFHDAHHAKVFLTHSDNHHAAKDYLNAAREHGTTHLYADNKRYEIKHEKGEDGKDKFSVRYAG